VGDLAAVPGVPGLAPAAIQGGRYAARAIEQRLRGRTPPPFRYLDKGNLATIGRAAAVAQIGRIHGTGLFAWLLWLFVHVLTLIGFRNRFLVLLEWAAVYLRNERGARLITGASHPLLEDATPSPGAGRPAPR
jgi:NADH dehydrogenase